MHSKKRIIGIVAAVVIGIPVVIVIAFFVRLAIDMHRVETRADNCKALIPAIYEFKNRVGRFPNEAEANEIDPHLRADCSYFNSGAEFSMGLSGSWVNMQVYGYSSEINQWYWD